MGRLRYTGHPFIDGGVALATAYSQVQHPADVTDENLRQLAQKIRVWRENTLFRNKVLSVAFTRNGAFTANMRDDKREQAIHQLLDSWQTDTAPTPTTQPCVFFPEYSAILSSDRRHIPLMTGDNIINFTPMGQGGIPVCGLALLLLSAMPFVTYQISGQLLLFHQLGVDTHFNTLMAGIILAHNQTQWLLTVSDQNASAWESPHPSAHTAYVETLLSVRRNANEAGLHAHLADITAYYFSNSGQNPDIRILQLDNNILDFLDAVGRRAITSWRAIVERGWQRSADHRRGRGRNRVHQLLFQLPDQSYAFLRYLISSRDWLIISLYLEKVLDMNPQHIDLLREVGDRLTEYALQHESSPTAFYYRIARAKSFDDLRRLIRSAGERYLKQSTILHPLITFDEFTLLFFHDTPYITWKTTRDLITFRMLERLTSAGQLDPDQITDDNDSLIETTES